MVSLVEMSEAAFREYRVELSRDYAQDKVRAGVWSAQEAKIGPRELEELLPEGTSTTGLFLYAVRDESIQATPDNLWLSVLDSSLGPSVWVYDT